MRAIAGKAGMVYREPLLLIKVNIIIGKNAQAKMIRLEPFLFMRTEKQANMKSENKGIPIWRSIISK